MYKRQHYALDHSERNSATSGSSSSLDTASDADSGGPEQVDDAAWPASSHESDESSQEEEVVEVDSTSVAKRRAEAIRIAEAKLAEAAEDAGEFEEQTVKAGDEGEVSEKSGNEADGSDAEGSDESKDVPELRKVGERNGTLVHGEDTDEDSSDVEPCEEALAQRKVSNQWAEAVDEDAAERILERFEGNTVLIVGEDHKVFKCRVCPKVICLNEETMKAHLVSKRHSRSMNQLAQGKLKIHLNSDGEEEEEGETHAERFARTLQAAEELKEKTKKRKRNPGRQRQRNRDIAKKKASTAKSETAVPSLTEKNRKERRALLHGGLSDAKSSTDKQTKGNDRDKLPANLQRKEKLMERTIGLDTQFIEKKKKRPRHM